MTPEREAEIRELVRKHPLPVCPIEEHTTGYKALAAVPELLAKIDSLRRYIADTQALTKAKENGYLACRYGVPRSSNPHELQSDLWCEWEGGFEEREDEEELDRLRADCGRDE